MERDEKIEIYVAAHKKLEMKMPDYCCPIQVNCARSHDRWEGYVHDDDGDNISEKNPFYCELTALYWGWKNSDADIKGLCHYRRFFSNEKGVNLIPLVYSDAKTLCKDCLSEDELQRLLKTYDAILPMQYSPYPDTAEENLERYCFKKDIDILKEVFRHYYPEYLDTLFFILNSRNMSYCNMMIARREIYDGYCEWLFEVLKHVEERCDISGYDVQHQRVYGYLAEVLLNVWFKYHNVKCGYVKLLIVHPTEKIRDRIIYVVLKSRSRIHRYLFEHNRYTFLLGICRLFRKEKYMRYIQYPQREENY